MSFTHSYLHNLPNELFLNILCKLNDIRDIIALLGVNNTISRIIQTDINYIIKKVSINNMNTYPQMYQIITYCYPNAPTIGNIRYNVGALAKIYKFIKSMSKAEIIQQSNELVFNSLQFTPNQKATYYRLRVFNNISHYVGMMAAILNIEQIVKMLNYIKDGIDERNSYDIAIMNDEDANKVFELKERSIDIDSAVRAVNAFDEAGINKMFELIGRGLPPVNAIDAIIDLSDEEIEVMFYLISKGISFDTARACGVYSEERQNNLIEIVSMGINDDNAFDIIQNNSNQGIKNFIKCLHHKIDYDFIEGIANEMTENQINQFIELTKNGICNEFAETIVKNFDDEKIIKFINLIKKNVNEEIAYDVANLFNDAQISKFLNIIKSNIDSSVAFNIINFYNKLQTQVVVNLVKNEIHHSEACYFVEKYDEIKLSKFMDLIFDDVDIKTAMDIITSSDNIEPPNKMQK
jgi:hypothetical protein